VGTHQMGTIMIKKLSWFKQLDYPLMRDPARQPKCYEMTEQERIEAVKKNRSSIERKAIVINTWILRTSLNERS
jgi:hypothetical protein